METAPLVPGSPPSLLSLRGLARVRAFFARLRPPRRLKLTREGRYYIAVTFGVGLVGIITANNLLYVLLGMLLSLIVVSGMLSDSALRDIRVHRKLPHRAQVGRPHFVEIEVHNDKKRMPSYAIEVEDLRAGQPADKRCFFLKVSPGSSQVAAYRRIPGRRGIDEHIGFRVATRFPFGLFEKSRQITLSGEIVIYPATDPIELPPRTSTERREGRTFVARGHGDDILGVRPMREGDDPRDIYWRRSTHSDHKVVRERAREVRAQVRLRLDDQFDGTEPGETRNADFERRVREVASLAVAHLRRGDHVTVESASGLFSGADPGTGSDPVLRFLALIALAPRKNDGSSVRTSQRAATSARRSALPAPPKASIVPAIPQLSRPARLPEPPGEEP